jgi:hypothetical protein
MKSIFSMKDEIPTENQLKEALGEIFNMCISLEKFTNENNPNSKSGWYFSGEKFGWSFRIKDKTGYHISFATKQIL